MERGQIWLLEEPDRPPRPSLVLTRSSVLPRLRSVTVAPLTRTIRGLPTEVELGPADGVRFDCVASFDNVATVSQAHLTRQLGALARGRWHEVCDAVGAAIDC